jgi:DNA modification methylase
MDVTGFSDSELEELMTQVHVGDDAPDAEPKIDQAAELQKKWGTKLGQIWELGEHRISCGDSTSAEVVGRLMGEDKAEMVFTDPPYNINYGNIKHPKFKERSIENDNKTPEQWSGFCEQIAKTISAVTDGCIYVCHAPNQDGRAIASILDAHFHCSTTIIWNKDAFTLGRGKYHNKYEPIWFGWVKSGKAFCDKRDLSNVWDIARPKVSELHPTIKPVEVVGRAIGHASKAKGIVFDPFLGSGTTLIACENLARKCRAIELAPEYVAVAIERWHEVTGKSPELLDG